MARKLGTKVMGSYPSLLEKLELIRSGKLLKAWKVSLCCLVFLEASS
jgi:hypothetical protein